MTPTLPRRRQRGIVLVVGMVILVLITLFVVSAYRMSTSHLTAVGNMQFRAQALAAAESATERVLGLPVLTTTFPAQIIDLNGDGNPEFSVTVVRSCLKATPILGASGSGTGSSVSLGFGSGAKEYSVLFDYQSLVSDVKTGAAATIHQGFKIQVTQAQCDAVCPLIQPCS
jgi:hypothetical protein